MNIYNEVELEKLKFAIQQRLTGEFMAKVDISIYSEFLADEIYLRVKGFVWAEAENVQHQEIKYPCDWWQAFKEKWFPVWILRHYPVTYKKVVIDVKAIYPEFKQAIDNHTMRLAIRRTDYS